MKKYYVLFLFLFYTNIILANDNDVSDFAWNKVTILKGDRDSTRWRETKQIQSLTFSRRGICFDRPLWDEWPHIPGHTLYPDWDSSPVVGKTYVVAKFNGRYYGGRWDFFVRGRGSCKLGHAGKIGGPNGIHMENIKKLYYELGTDQIRVAPMDRTWVLQLGDVIGFFVTSIAQSNTRERSNIYWYRVPKEDGSGGGAVSNGRGNNNNGQDTRRKMPNLYHLTEEVAREHPEALKKSGHNTREGWEFLDRVIQKLHSVDPRFGYRWRHRARNPNDKIISFDMFAYYEGEGNPQGKTNRSGNLIMVDFIYGASTPNPRLRTWRPEHWSKDPNTFSEWVYPRPGAPNYGYDPNFGGSVVDDDSSTQGCNSNQRTPHWQEVDGVCKPSCGHAGNIYCKANDCSGMGYNYGKICNSDRKVRDLTSYQTPCCLLRDNNSRNICKLNQNMPRWKSVASECLPSCKTARRLYCKDNNCDGLRLSESCEQADNTEVQNLRSYQTPCCLVRGTTFFR